MHNKYQGIDRNINKFDIFETSTQSLYELFSFLILSPKISRQIKKIYQLVFPLFSQKKGEKVCFEIINSQQTDHMLK